MKENKTLILSDNHNSAVSKERNVRNLADKFVHEFDNASKMHFQSDNYKFYYGYNSALHIAFQLAHIEKNGFECRGLPGKLLAGMQEKEKKFYYKLAGSMNLLEANKKKRLLLDWFYSILQKLKIHSSGEINSIKKCLEKIYDRDLVQNFRDIANYNPACRHGIVFRSSCLTRCQQPGIFKKFIEKTSITTIVDLRMEKEIAAEPYKEELLKKFNISHQPFYFNIKTPQEFKDEFPEDNGLKRMYRWLVAGPDNKNVFKDFFTSINPEKEVILIHCNAGKDRTGVLCAIIAMLAGEKKKNIERDYLASEMDTDIEYIRAFFKTLDDYGGPEKYLISCGIPTGTVDLWKNAVKNFNRGRRI